MSKSKKEALEYGSVGTSQELTPLVTTFLGVGVDAKGQHGVFVAKVDVANQKLVSLELKPEPDRIEAEFRFKVTSGELILTGGR